MRELGEVQARSLILVAFSLSLHQDEEAFCKIPALRQSMSSNRSFFVWFVLHEAKITIVLEFVRGYTIVPSPQWSVNRLGSFPDTQAQIESIQ